MSASRRSVLRMYRDRVPRLIEKNLHAARQHHHRGSAKPGIVRFALELDAPRSKIADRLLKVVAHERNLVLALVARRRSIGWVYAEFRGRRLKISQPWPASTDLKPRTSRRTARKASASDMERTIWLPMMAMLFVLAAFVRKIVSQAAPTG